MFYRLITVIGGLVFVVVLYGLVWFFCKQFLQRHGVTEQLADRTTVLATWTFAGISVGLVLFVAGAFLVGPYAFYRTLGRHEQLVSDGAAIFWGLGVVTASLVLTAAGFMGFLKLVGAY